MKRFSCSIDSEHIKSSRCLFKIELTLFGLRMYYFLKSSSGSVFKVFINFFFVSTEILLSKNENVTASGDKYHKCPHIFLMYIAEILLLTN